MTKAERNQKIVRLIEARTKRGLKSKKAARTMLISEGIYTEKGNLKKEFGGRGSGSKAGTRRPANQSATG
ncbi:MAG TPA: hypothetical protein VEB68_05415 [Croceibacterium sp.]|nr:hypothetical protein [Croceibacterium sp.]